MKDLAGNDLLAGNLLFWLPQKLFVEVVATGAEDDPRDKKRTIETLTVKFKMALPSPQNHNESLMLQDFIRVVNPAEQNFLEKAASGNRPV